MKYLVPVFVLSMVALSLAGALTEPEGRGCIYVNGKCQRECEEGTHAYTTGCGQKMPEATCDVPNPVEETGDICDYSACYCDPPTVRDKHSGKCVTLDLCPQND